MLQKMTGRQWIRVFLRQYRIWQSLFLTKLWKLCCGGASPFSKLFFNHKWTNLLGLSGIHMEDLSQNWKTIPSASLILLKAIKRRYRNLSLNLRNLRNWWKFYRDIQACKILDSNLRRDSLSLSLLTFTKTTKYLQKMIAKALLSQHHHET